MGRKLLLTCSFNRVIVNKKWPFIVKPLKSWGLFDNAANTAPFFKQKKSERSVL